MAARRPVEGGHSPPARGPRWSALPGTDWRGLQRGRACIACRPRRGKTHPTTVAQGEVLLFALLNRGPKEDGVRNARADVHLQHGMRRSGWCRVLTVSPASGPPPGTVNSFSRTARGLRRVSRPAHPRIARNCGQKQLGGPYRLPLPARPRAAAASENRARYCQARCEFPLVLKSGRSDPNY